MFFALCMQSALIWQHCLPITHLSFHVGISPNMSDSEPCVKRLKKCTLTTYKRKPKHTEIIRYKRNKLRRERRKRSITRYYKVLNRKRSNQSTEELCEATLGFCINDNMATTEGTSSQLKDVADWWKQDQLMYWKSRALSLELENRMLHQCLRNSYAKQVWDYENYIKTQNIEENDSTIKEEAIKDEEKLPPKENVREERRREMNRLYGGMAPKIIGMETAVQLNYELQVDQHKPPYWPNIPLNL